MQYTILKNRLKSFLVTKNNGTACRFRNIQCHYFCFHRYTKQHIFLYTIISNGEFDLFSFSGADALKGELRSPASACVIRNPPNFVGSLLTTNSGADALKGELRSPASACVIRNPPNFVGSLLTTNSGPGGSRTRVQTGIPCSSTIIVSSSIFLYPVGN